MPALAVVTAVATVTPDNTPHGYNLTFAVPMGLFVVVAVVMYLLLGRPHRRIPARRGVMPARQLAPPDRDAARAASIAGGLAVAAGGGSAESHLEAAGHVYGAGTGGSEVPGAEAEAPAASSEAEGEAEAGSGSGAAAGPPAGDGPAAADGTGDGQ